MDITKLQEHPLLNELPTIITYSEFELTGGAVIDILEGRKPKDYDFVGLYEHNIEKLVESGFNFKSATKTAFTLEKGEYTVQILRNGVETFDYTISQAKYNCNKKTLTIDKVSFEKKILIPTTHTFEKKGKTLNALKRVPHYERKGYKLPEATYLSMLNNLSLKGGQGS